MKIEVLGMGCASCNKLYQNALEAVKQSGKEVQVVKVEDIQKIIGRLVERGDGVDVAVRHPMPADWERRRVDEALERAPDLLMLLREFHAASQLGTVPIISLCEKIGTVPI